MKKNPLKIGDVIEVDNKDNRGRSGKSILLVGDFGPVDNVYMCDFLGSSEKEYNDFIFKEEKHPNPGLYKVYVKAGDDNPNTCKDQKLKKVCHIYKYRVLSSRGEDINLEACSWLKGRQVTRVASTLKDLIVDLPPEESHEAPPKRARTSQKESEHPGDKAVLLPGAARLPYSRVEMDLGELRDSI